MSEAWAAWVIAALLRDYVVVELTEIRVVRSVGLVWRDCAARGVARRSRTMGGLYRVGVLLVKQTRGFHFASSVYTDDLDCLVRTILWSSLLEVSL